VILAGYSGLPDLFEIQFYISGRETPERDIFAAKLLLEIWEGIWGIDYNYI